MGKIKVRGYARDEILRFAQNDKDGEAALPYIWAFLQP